MNNKVSKPYHVSLKPSSVDTDACEVRLCMALFAHEKTPERLEFDPFDRTFTIPTIPSSSSVELEVHDGAIRYSCLTWTD